MDGEILACSVEDKTLLKTKFINIVSRNIAGSIKSGAIIEPFEMTYEVIVLPDGGQVIPYFKDSDSRWKIVLISQYRPAVQEKTFEGAGGRIDDESAKMALSRELQEETGIKVDPQIIRIVFHEYGNSSIVSASVYGGIVQISAGMVEDKKEAENQSENERTQVEVFDLIRILKNRDNEKIMMDLLTSRLLDEVAKATGLLAKKY